MQFGYAYDLYVKCCDSEGVKNQYDKKSFKKILQGSGYEIAKSMKDSNQFYIFGVTLI